MKTRIASIIFTCSVVLLTSVNSLFAQNSGMIDVQMIESEVNYERINTAGGESEIKSAYKTPLNNTFTTPKEKDPESPISPISKENLLKENSTKENSNQSKIKAEKPAPVAKETVNKQSKNQEESVKPKDDSILSFNFLYYIIEKYKLQDIVD